MAGHPIRYCTSVEQQKVIVFAAQATTSSGAGHLRRCIRFAQGLNNDYQKYHVGQVDIGWLVPAKSTVFDSIGDSFSTSTKPLVVIDSYDEVFCRTVVASFPESQILQVADRYTPVLEGVWVLWLDFPDGKLFEAYKNRIVASGIQMMPIPKIARLNTGFEREAKSVLVTTGGSPSIQVIESLRMVLSNPEYKKLNFHFLGKSLSSEESNSNFHYYEPGVALEQLCYQVDTVITACGTSLWDFLANGFCVGAIKLVENQSRNFEFVTTSKQAVPLDLSDSLELLTNSLDDLFFNVDTRKDLFAASKSYDFKGVYKFRELIAGFYE